MPENNLFAIKKRITAATQTRKITRTMELIASSRLQRGKTLLAGFQLWLTHMGEAVRVLPDSYFAPLEDNESGEDKKKAYIVFGGSKGLSGAYSPNLLQYAKPIVAGHIVLAVGSAAEMFFHDAHSVFADDLPSATYAKGLAIAAKTLFESRQAHEVYMIYTQSSRHITKQLLPLIRPEEYIDNAIKEPSEQVLFPVLFDEYCQSLLYETHLHAFISEQVARVSAMDSATRNADEIVEDLQATYNRMRQSAITQEIITLSNAAR